MLIPSDMEQFTPLEASALETVFRLMGVDLKKLCVWQQVTLQVWPSHLLIVFILEVVKHLQ
jgi:hypothetical protein